MSDDRNKIREPTPAQYNRKVLYNQTDNFFLGAKEYILASTHLAPRTIKDIQVKGFDIIDKKGEKGGFIGLYEPKEYDEVWALVMQIGDQEFFIHADDWTVLYRFNGQVWKFYTDDMLDAYKKDLRLIIDTFDVVIQPHERDFMVGALNSLEI